MPSRPVTTERTPRSSQAKRSVDLLYVITDMQSTVFLAPIIRELASRKLCVGLITNTHGQPLPERIEQCLSFSEPIPFRRNPSPFLDLWHLLRLTRLIRKLRPVVVHSSTPKAGLLGGIASWICRVPNRVYQVRGFRGEGSTGIQRMVLAFSERIAMAAATNVVFNSASLQNAAGQAGLSAGTKATVLGAGSSTGVDLQRFRPKGNARAESPPTLGFVGRIHSDKGVEDLRVVITRVRAAMPDVRLAVVGAVDSSDPGSVHLWRRLQTTDGVDMLGSVDDVSEVIPNWSMLLFPSLREGLPNAPLEAQACGVPVVGYAATGTVDAVENGCGGVLVPVGNTEALTDAVIELLSTPPRLDELCRQARGFVTEHFDQTQVVEAHTRFLETLVTKDLEPQ